jgi:hypothetical protein
MDPVLLSDAKHLGAPMDSCFDPNDVREADSAYSTQRTRIPLDGVF